VGSDSGSPYWPRLATPDSLMTTGPTARLAHPPSAVARLPDTDYLPRTAMRGAADYLNR
jgi:hypothetical protein